MITQTKIDNKHKQLKADIRAAIDRAVGKHYGAQKLPMKSADRLKKRNMQHAPEIWKKIPALRKCQPSSKDQFISLVRFGTSDVVAWYVTTGGGVWEMASNPYLITIK